MAKKKIAEKMSVPSIKMSHLIIPIVGIDGPLVVHHWGEKAIRDMLGHQLGEINVSTKRDAKDPEADYLSSLYISEDGEYGFPACAFKSAIVAAANDIVALKMTQLRRNLFVVYDIIEHREYSFQFQVPADNNGSTKQKGKKDKKATKDAKVVTFDHIMKSELVQIKGTPRKRMDMVRIGGMSKSADIRFRAEFPEWSAMLHIKYTNFLSKEEVFNLVKRAGITIGIGEGRPEKKTDMGWGRFAIDHRKEAKELGGIE